MPLIAEQVAKFYGIETALAGINLTIPEGQIVALTGPSGAGKSTLLHCLAGISPVSRGHIRFHQYDLFALSPRQRAQLRAERFGLIFPNQPLLPELKVIENLALPLLILGYSRRAATTYAQTRLADLELTHLSQRFTYQLSAGQWQKIAILRALVTSPEIIFADEPQTRLDPAEAQQVLQYLTTYAKRRQATLLIATPDPLVTHWAEREITLFDGLITHDRPLTAGENPHVAS